MIVSTKTLIIIPVYNAQDYIERSIVSALNQTKLAPIWVVDNCSNDRTQEIVRTYCKKNKQVKLIVNEKNLGRVGNWNRCLDLFSESSYLYIKFIFSGDEILPKCIEETEKIFSAHRNIGAIAFDYEFVGMNGQVSISDSPMSSSKLLSIKEINRINLEGGGLLGAIICNVYSKNAISNFRFNPMFIGKADFDYDVLSSNKAYYLKKVLARFNLDAHRTFFKAQDYIVEAEYAFNRAYHLEKNKNLFDDKEYKLIREKILIEFVTRNMNYYPLSTLLRLFASVMVKLPQTVLFKLSKMKQKYLLK